MFNLIQRLVAPFIMFGWATYYFMEVSGQKPGSQYLIRPVYYILAVLFIIIVFNEYKRWKKEWDAESAAERKADSAKLLSEAKVVITFVGGTAFYLLLLPYVGFIIATPVFLCAAFRYLKASWKMSVTLSVLLTAFVFVVFKVLLGVPLPMGFIKM